MPDQSASPALHPVGFPFRTGGEMISLGELSEAPK
jgi:hypothetical protein